MTYKLEGGGDRNQERQQGLSRLALGREGDGRAISKKREIGNPQNLGEGAMSDAGRGGDLLRYPGGRHVGIAEGRERMDDMREVQERRSKS